MTHVNWDDAVAYAESIGKRLPDETEYEYAATKGGRQLRRLAALQGWAIAPSGQPEIDRWEIPGQPPIFGLCSNVAEWTGSWAVRYPGMKEPASHWMQRVVRGGPPSSMKGEPNADEKWAPQDRLFRERPLHYPGLGFRCALSPAPRLKAEDFIAIVP
jgi:formylglycine-generating enzyme required for sulfatase activity